MVKPVDSKGFITESIEMRIALLGGTFNPIHNGHLTIAKEVYRQLQLDLVLLTPSSNPPHKNETLLASYEERFKMIELAVSPLPYLQASRLDFTSYEKSYTKNLILRTQKAYPSADLFFIIGSDNVPELVNWYDFPWLIANVKFVAVPRPHYDFYQYKELSYYSKITTLQMIPITVSSKEIRARIAQNLEIRELVPEPVNSYISSKHLYQMN